MNDDYKAARGAIGGSEPAEAVIRRARDGQGFDVSTLRAEVERLRDEAARSPLINTRGLGAVVAKSRVSAFSEVLDLIDRMENG